jgi:hypothetical protein
MKTNPTRPAFEPAAPAFQGGGEFWQQMRAAQRRTRQRLVRELTVVGGLMPLLMKQRNGGRWTAEEKRRLQARLRHLANLSPVLILLLLPGSVALIPLYAWWLDRRRKRRPAPPIE